MYHLLTEEKEKKKEKKGRKKTFVILSNPSSNLKIFSLPPFHSSFSVPTVRLSLFTTTIFTSADHRHDLIFLFPFCPSPPSPLYSHSHFFFTRRTLPSLSDFTSLLTSTSVSSDLLSRSSVTLLAVPNSYLRHSDPSSLADVIRYHVLLQYLSWSDLAHFPSSGKLITTLYQTTGRATNNFGSLNITRNPDNGAVFATAPIPYSPSNATFISSVKSLPYNLSIFTINSLLIPSGFNLVASETRPANDVPNSQAHNKIHVSI